MPTKTLTVTLPTSRLKFIEDYRKAHSLKSQSEVIEIALSLLRESELEAEISEAPEQDDLSDMDLSDPEGRDDDSR